ncbi:MAG: 9-O-acetylesterase, partial [Phycisphaerae bacterium]|nr:9-O-acetylesterase [Phycisphaerae bacterium]
SELDVPVGLINAAFGATRIIPWVAPQGIAELHELAEIVTEMHTRRQQYRKQLARQIDAMDAWVDKTRAALAESKPIPLSRWPRNPLGWHYAPSSLYNAMVHPFTAMPVRGALWYQGEANVRHQQLYRQKMLALIRGWRGAWDQPDMPFYYVQLAPFRFKTAATPYEIPKLREIQTSVLAEPNTGMVVTTDVGDIVDIHPRDKAAVGERLALWALAKTYGRPDIVYCGPMYKSLAVEGDKIRISFEHVGGGLISTDHKPLSWFEIAGADGRYTPAKAKIDGASVLVHSPEVPQPVAVRFAWHEEAQPNLANAEGLPAGPFRTNSP